MSREDIEARLSKCRECVAKRLGRVLIGIVAPCGTWRLRREIDRRSGH